MRDLAQSNTMFKLQFQAAADQQNLILEL